MAAPAHPNASPALIALWLDRYRTLNSLMQARPQDPSLWVWTVQHRILGYLLQRYGGQTSAPELMNMPVQDFEPETLRPAGFAPSACATQRPVSGKPPYRTASVLRSNLQQLRELNASRYVRLEEEQREENRQKALYLAECLAVLSFPTTKSRFSDEKILQNQRSIIFDEVLAISEFMSGGQPISTEQIIAFLSDEGPSDKGATSS